MKLQLFTTLGCHLCEQAEQIVAELQQTSHPELRLSSVEIADEPDLFERYGIRIPVVKLESHEDDLGWPFTKAMLIAYLDQP